MKAGRFRALAAALLVLLVGPWPQAQAAADEVALKAAVTYSLLQFTQWPGDDTWTEGSTLNVCADAAGPWWGPLRAMARRPVRRSVLEVLDTPPAMDIVRACHVLVITPGGRVASARLVAGRPVLTVSDGVGDASAIVNLQRAGDRLVFDIDLAAARASRLVISSKALRLAREVRE